jgi:hypothetical protein
VKETGPFSSKRLGDPEALGENSELETNALASKWSLFLPLERAKNIFAFSPLVSGYEAKDTVECS